MTVHGHLIAHYELAAAWVRYNGLRGTEAQILRIMNRLNADQLRRMLAERRIDTTCPTCDGDGYGAGLIQTCQRCGGGGKL